MSYVSAVYFISSLPAEATAVLFSALSHQQVTWVFCVFYVHDTAASRGQYLALSKA